MEEEGLARKRIDKDCDCLFVAECDSVARTDKGTLYGCLQYKASRYATVDSGSHWPT